MKTIPQIIAGAQILFPINYDIQECFEEYSEEEHKEFINEVRVIESAYTFIDKEQHMGRPAYPVNAFRRAFYAQSKFRLNTLEELRSRLRSDCNLRLICGFKRVPSLSTFCRRLNEMAETKEADCLHEKIIKKYMAGKLILHVNRDSTAVEARQRVIKRETTATIDNTKKYRRGRPRKDDKQRVKKPDIPEQQCVQSPEESIEKLECTCQWGCKKNSQGNHYIWKGYKIHLDVSDTGIPLTAVITGANVHDSRLAIPMEKLTERRCTFLYSLMDSAYDAGPIHDFIKSRHIF